MAMLASWVEIETLWISCQGHLKYGPPGRTISTCGKA